MQQITFTIPEESVEMDFWNEIPQELKEAKQELKEGKIKNHKEVMQKYEAWI